MNFATIATMCMNSSLRPNFFLLFQASLIILPSFSWKQTTWPQVFIYEKGFESRYLLLNFSFRYVKSEYVVPALSRSFSFLDASPKLYIVLLLFCIISKICWILKIWFGLVYYCVLRKWVVAGSGNMPSQIGHNSFGDERLPRGMEL